MTAVAVARQASPHLVRTASEPNFSISWPGCGVMVFWQLGVLKGLSRHVDTCSIPMLGSSSGALVTALAACGVRPDDAAAEVQRLLARADSRNRRFGLFGVLGDITRTWLENCLPSDAGSRVSRRSTLLVTRLPLLTTHHITTFASKQDVVDVVMASAHLPLLLDGTWYALCRQQPVIDGGFWWWWHRCEAAYRVPGGAPFTTAAAAAGSPAAAAAAPSGALRALQQQHPQQHRQWRQRQPPPSSPPPPLVSYCSPLTSPLDFMTADVQRLLAGEACLCQGAAAAAAAIARAGSGAPGAWTAGSGSGMDQTDCRAAATAAARPAVSACSAGGVAQGAPGSALLRGLTAWAAPGDRHSSGVSRGHTAAPQDPQAPYTSALPYSLKLPAQPPPAAPAAMAPPAADHAPDDGRCCAPGARGSPPHPHAHPHPDSHSNPKHPLVADAAPTAAAAPPAAGVAAAAGLAVLLVQPADDEALAAQWRRYRRWRPNDLAAAREMMSYGEAYGSGPLMERLERLS